MKRSLYLTALLGFAPLAQAASDEAINTAWVVTASARVFFMQAGFALLESGMSRAKNAVNVMMKNFMDGAVGSIVFWLVGFGLMFGANPSGWVGTDKFLLHAVAEADYGMLFFQMMFAATAATIVSGANAGQAFELPALGNMSYENLVANPYEQNKTIIAATDDEAVNEAVSMAAKALNIPVNVVDARRITLPLPSLAMRVLPCLPGKERTSTNTGNSP